MNNITDIIGNLITEARKKVYSNINSIMVFTYWEIGKVIVEEEQKGETRAKYGENLIKKLSQDLTRIQGKGFSERNLRNFRKFYLNFPKSETLSAKLSWSHYTAILRIDEPLKRNFYIKEIESENWSIRELKRQMNSALFERLAISRNKTEIIELSQKGQVLINSKGFPKTPHHHFSQNSTFAQR